MHRTTLRVLETDVGRDASPPSITGVMRIVLDDCILQQAIGLHSEEVRLLQGPGTKPYSR